MQLELYHIITTFIAVLGVLIAAGGLAVSIVSLRRSRANTVQAIRLQEKQEELTDLQLKLHLDEIGKIEQSNESLAYGRPADIRVGLEGSAKSARFVIRNWGYSAATNINLEVTPLEGRSSPLVYGDANEKLPIPRLAPGSDRRLIAALSFDTGTTFDLSWTWTQEDGTQEQQSSRVSL